MGFTLFIWNARVREPCFSVAILIFKATLIMSAYFSIPQDKQKRYFC